jgi:diguanylate cyclase (GGDEF)-like protein/PAS domain S-box-containing protein
VVITTALLLTITQLRAVEDALVRQAASTQSAALELKTRNLEEKLQLRVDALSRGSRFAQTELTVLQSRPGGLQEARGALLSLYDRLLLTDTNGRVIATAPPNSGRIGVDLSDREYLRAAIAEGQSQVAGPLRARTGGAPIAVVAAPATNEAGQVQGVLIGVLNLLDNSFLGTLGRQAAPGGGQYFVVSGGLDPLVIAHADTTQVMTPDARFRRSEQLHALLERLGPAAGHVAQEVDGSFYSLERMRTTGWIVGASVSRADIQAPVSAAKRALWWVLGLVAAASVPLIWLASAVLLNPLTDIGRRLARPGRGHPVSFPESARNDEFGALARAIEGAFKGRADAEQTLTELTANVPASLMLLDARERLVFVNAAFASFWGRAPEDLIGEDTRRLVGEEEYRVIGPMLKRALSGEAVTFHRESHRGGEPRLLQSEYTPRRDAERRVVGVYAVVSDITSRRSVEKSIQQQANQDVLTGLPNRRLALLWLESALRARPHVGILFLDVDRFKSINDEHGHLAGDVALLEFAERIKRAVRGGDLVARLGGDEFVVLLDDVAELNQVLRVAENVQAQMRDPVRIRTGLVIEMGTSIGVAFLPTAGLTPERALEIADQALYQAKQGGRGRSVTAPALQAVR